MHNNSKLFHRLLHPCCYKQLELFPWLPTFHVFFFNTYSPANILPENKQHRIMFTTVINLMLTNALNLVLNPWLPFLKIETTSSSFLWFDLVTHMINKKVTHFTWTSELTWPGFNAGHKYTNIHLYTCTCQPTWYAHVEINLASALWWSIQAFMPQHS